MKHADKFYESQLNTINEKLVKMGSLLEKQFASALEVLDSRDEQLAQKVVDNDHEINLLNHEISDFVFQIIAMRQPIADDLRFLFCTIKIIRDLERIGDHITSIAKKATRVSKNIPSEFTEKLRSLGLRPTHQRIVICKLLFDLLGRMHYRFLLVDASKRPDFSSVYS